MPKLYSSEEIIRVLQKHEFRFVSQKGSHVKYRKEGSSTLTVIIPAERKQNPWALFIQLCDRLIYLKKILKENNG